MRDGKRGDVDNLAKNVLDSCNGVLWDDDRQVDQLGVVLGHQRPDGLSDALYRWVLHAVVIALRSSGTGPNLSNSPTRARRAT